jgi:pimeloyl-ACP methyl ester carboxylesterase/8-oxo-dGTP pyrophosphatase MutT (NUDIX family)
LYGSYMSSQGFIAASDGKLYYEDTGTGEPIIFIHSFTLDRRMWWPQVDALSKTYRTITYDVRGFGQSSIPTEPYAHYDDLLALLDHLKIAKVHLAGLSMGGGIASAFTILHPERVTSLTLLDSDLHGYPSSVDWNVHADEVGIDGAKANWLAHDVFAQTRTNKEVTRELTEAVRDYSGWHWLHRDFDKRIDVRRRLHEIVCPVQMVVGEKDLSYFHEIAQFICDHIPQAKLNVIEGVGHMTNMEAPEECSKLIEETVGTIEATTKSSRDIVRQAVAAIEPFDALEREHKADVLSWIGSGVPIFRIEKPDKPDKHLVSYFVLYDEAQNLFMLIDHAKAKLWLPPGGHVDIDEDPKQTVIREAKEELAIDAEFLPQFGDKPVFVTVTTTIGYGNHTDVSLWYIIRGDSSIDLRYDSREMGGYKWFSPEEILTSDGTQFDPHIQRFIRKMQGVMS